MKLEGELPYFQSNIGREPESESFELGGNELYKLQNQKVKEYENNVSIDLKRNERDLDLSSYEKKSADCMTTPKLEFYDSIIDLKDEYAAQVRDFVDPVSLASKDVDSFMKFPNDTKPVKRSPTSPISDPPEERDPFENSVDVYMDKTIKECEPKPVVCYKESNRVVKDICVDEGVPTKDKVLFEKSVDEKAYNLFPYIPNEDKEMKKDNIGINVLNLPATEESDQVSANRDQSQDSMHKDEPLTEKLYGNVNKEPLPGDKVLLQELDRQESRASDDKGEQVSQESQLHAQSEESENTVEEELLPSHPTLVSAVDESNSDSVLLENGSFVYMFNPSASAACGKEECHQVGGCRCDDTQNMSKPVDEKSDVEAVTSEVHNSLDESRFSAIGPVSSRISYSGSVPYSGSISIRSDSSTTSTRSFAFPILQSEWNSSPVRMAKADRSKYRKHRCWRQSLLCCGF